MEGATQFKDPKANPTADAAEWVVPSASLPQRYKDVMSEMSATNEKKAAVANAPFDCGYVYHFAVRRPYSCSALHEEGRYPFSLLADLLHTALESVLKYMPVELDYFQNVDTLQRRLLAIFEATKMWIAMKGPKAHVLLRERQSKSVPYGEDVLAVLAPVFEDLCGVACFNWVSEYLDGGERRALSYEQIWNRIHLFLKLGLFWLPVHPAINEEKWQEVSAKFYYVSNIAKRGAPAKLMPTNKAAV